MADEEAPKYSNTITIELIDGLKRGDEIHKEVVFRKPTVQDWMKVSQDIGVQEIGRIHGHLPLGSTLGSLIARGPTFSFYAVLLNLITEKFGSLESWSRKDFLDLSTNDLDLLILTLNIFLGLVSEKEVKRETDKSPLASKT